MMVKMTIMIGMILLVKMRMAVMKTRIAMMMTSPW